MRQYSHEALCEALLPIARQAGEAIMAVYRAGALVSRTKADASPVTAADLAAHQILVQGLSTLLADCPIVSEEDEVSHALRYTLARFWLIDPLDGTKEFLTGNGEFTVNIALIEEGRSVLGVVYAPAQDALYWGGAGWGAWRCNAGETVVIRVRAANETAVGGICRVVASKSHLNEATQSFIDLLGPVNLVQAGSSLKFCRIAEGLADLYPRLAPTCEWDTAAAQAVLEGAGGQVLGIEGEPLRYGKRDVLNPCFIATRDVTLIPA